MNNEVNAWEEIIQIPTYSIGTPEKNPMFLEKRVYQGSSGSVYPQPVIESISEEKTDKPYRAVFIENEYLRIMVLPELGGRIHMAYDKVRQRHFIYYNEVIKPALVGLTGPWISGGIEFNWPQHHRPSTFLPVDYCIRSNDDGSKTIWVNEMEIMTHQKGMAGFTLYPGKAYLEVKGRLFNRTPFPQSFLWWANPAVKVNDHYQSVFPPDVYAVYDHGKRDVSDFPIATGTYYKVNYSPGTDISRYKNIPVPTSYMAVGSNYNFLGGYEHDTHAGMLHVANRRISPGKKQWTWGNGDFGHAWDRNLTDNDGPYVEIMTGVFTDNQPDFSWINPNEGKSFEQYFMPYSKLGLVKNATRDAAINVEHTGNDLKIMVYATSIFDSAEIVIRKGDRVIKKFVKTISPEAIFETTLPAPKSDFSVHVFSRQGKALVGYTPEKPEKKDIPPPAEAMPAPQEVETMEMLYLNGLHLEQYRHATFLPTDYYLEGLRREPGDVRCNNAMGLWLLRKGQLTRAEPYFRAAIQTLTVRNPNPYDGEAYYNLGLTLFYQCRLEEAYDAFYKATWNDAFQHTGFLWAARIDAQQRRFDDAVRLIDQSLVRNFHSHSARHLKVILLRKLGKTAQALACINESLAIDPFNFGCLFEKYLLASQSGNAPEATQILMDLRNAMRGEVNNYMEYAFDYIAAGCYKEAFTLLAQYEEKAAVVYPMALYAMAWCAAQSGEPGKSASYYEKAKSASPDYCFPNRIEEMLLLIDAVKANPKDSKAFYYVGNFWYWARQYDLAIKAWEDSIRLDPAFPTAHRNLALAYCNKLHDPKQAQMSLEKAFALDPSDSRILMELDQLYKHNNMQPAARLEFLENYQALVALRDDLYLEMVALYNMEGNFEHAKSLLLKRHFHPWEGGEGKVVGQYILAQIELAKIALEKEQYSNALELLAAATVYPGNLGEGKLFGAKENDIYYWKGIAYLGLGENALAADAFRKATIGKSDPAPAIFYNDAPPDKIFYQGQAWLSLGEQDKARAIFDKLLAFGRHHLNDRVQIDYFAVSLPDLLVFEADLDKKNRIHCHYLQGLGYLGLGKTEEAKKAFTLALAEDENHMGARVHLRMLQFSPLYEK